MRLRLDTTQALAKRIPALQANSLRAIGGRQYVLKRQQFLADVIGSAFAGTRRHSKNPKAFSLSRDAWIEGLSATPHGYKKLLVPFFEFEASNRGYSSERGLTKAYRLRPEVLEAARAVFDGEAPLAVVDRDSGEFIDPQSLPSNGLPESARLPFSVPSVLRLRVEEVDSAIATVKRWRDIYKTGRAPLDPDKPDKTTLNDALQQLRVCRLWARSLGGIPNAYKVQGNGRLSPADGLSPHVIPLPGMLRRLLFASSGLVDYDIKAAFPSIFVSLGNALGFSTCHAKDYLSNRAEWHTHFLGVTGCSHAGAIKETILSWLCGAPLSHNPRTAAYRLLGSEGLRLLTEDTRARDLHREVWSGMKAVLAHTQRVSVDRYSAPVNAVGMVLKKDEAPTSAEESSHVLTGLEQYVMRCICSQVHGLQGIVFDGYLAPPHDTKPIEQLVKQQSEQELGIPIHITLKASPFSTPIPDPEPDW